MNSPRHIEKMGNAKLIYPITTGRTGTVYLSELFKNNTQNSVVYHERATPLGFGVNTPDASHFTTFNTIGNNNQVREFWRQKLERDSSVEVPIYIEMSHFLAKAGLIENLDLLGDDTNVVLLALKRDIRAVLWSFINRFDFFNLGFTWLFSLDPRYRNIIVKSAAYMKHGMFGTALWYIHEMQTRTEYYRILTSGNAKIRFMDVDLEQILDKAGAVEFLEDILPGELTNRITLPERRNETKTWFFDDAVREHAMQLVSRMVIDPVELAGAFIASGKRLAHPDFILDTRTG